MKEKTVKQLDGDIYGVRIIPAIIEFIDTVPNQKYSVNLCIQNISQFSKRIRFHEPVAQVSNLLEGIFWLIAVSLCLKCWDDIAKTTLVLHTKLYLIVHLWLCCYFIIYIDKNCVLLLLCFLQCDRCCLFFCFTSTRLFFFYWDIMFTFCWEILFTERFQSLISQLYQNHHNGVH